MLDLVLELIAPLRCAGCDRPGAALCESCWSEVVRIDPRTACPRCGAPERRQGCRSCESRAFAFGAVRCFGLLQPPLSTLIAVHKDPGERRYGPVLGALAASACADWAGWPDAIVPVPPTAAARMRRGYDHTRPIGLAVSERLGAPVRDLLIASALVDQRSLGRNDRHANVQGAFKVRAVQTPAHVLLVDDVMTTGATLDAAARALLEAGVRGVRAAVVARA